MFIAFTFNSMPVDITFFPFSIINIAHFSIPNSIPICLLKTRAVWTSKSNSFSLRLYNFKSSINKRPLTFSLLPKISYAALTFLKIELNLNNAKTNSNGDKESFEKYLTWYRVLLNLSSLYTTLLSTVPYY